MNSLIGKSVIPEGLTNKTGLKQRSRRYMLAPGANDDQFKALLE